jgi:hypothetical protein
VSETIARPGSAKGPRDYRLDFFRGLALFFIFIDHIPDNKLRYVTLHAIAFSDAAEVFIFISGFTAALVYGRAMVREGFLMGACRVYRRVWQLYVAHLCLFLIYSAEVAYTVLKFNNPLFADELRVGGFLNEPAVTILRVLTLQFQPTFLDILPLYIFLLAGFPLVLAALRVHWAVALVPSVALYVGVRLGGIDMPAWPAGDTWYFNPFTWQLLFVIGAIFGYAEGQGRRLFVVPAWLLLTAACVALFGVVVVSTWTLHEMTGWFPPLLYAALWPVDKSNLPFLRLFSMLALALLVGQLVSQQAGFLTSRVGWIVVLCGQNSLEIFCLSILLAVLAHMVQTVLGTSLPVQLLVNFFGLGMMVLLGLMLAWFDAGGRFPPRPRKMPVST